MTTRRTFIGATLAASAAGFAGLARRAGPATVEFYGPVVAKGGRAMTSGQVLGNLAGHSGTPERVELASVQVGHFHGLAHEGDGRVAYLYEATLSGRQGRRGFVKLGQLPLLNGTSGGPWMVPIRFGNLILPTGRM